MKSLKYKKEVANRRRNLCKVALIQIRNQTDIEKRYISTYKGGRHKEDLLDRNTDGRLRKQRYGQISGQTQRKLT